MHPRGKAAGIRTASGLAGCAGVRESRHCYLADAAARGLKADSSHQPLLLPEPVGEVPLGGGRGGRQVLTVGGEGQRHRYTLRQPGGGQRPPPPCRHRRQVIYRQHRLIRYRLCCGQVPPIGAYGHRLRAPGLFAACGEEKDQGGPGLGLGLGPRSGSGPPGMNLCHFCLRWSWTQPAPTACSTT